MPSLDLDFSIVESYCWWNKWFLDHAKSSILSKLEGYVWPEPYEKFQVMLDNRSCPICQGDHFIRFVEPVLVREISLPAVWCVCTILEQMDKKYAFESSWRPEFLKDIKELPPKESAAFTKQIKEEAEDFIKHPFMWYYLYGGYGSGKTKVLNAIKYQLRGLALYINSSDFSQAIFKATADHTLGELLADVIDAPVLLFDDIGVEHKNSEYVYAAYYNVINGRYIMGTKAPSYVTSNKTIPELRTFRDENMGRIASRLGDIDLVCHQITKQSDYRTREA